MSTSSEAKEIAGQLSAEERELLTNSIRTAAKKPLIVIEVGTWLGGGSTLHILRALEANGVGHLYGIEADQSIYDQMMVNIQTACPDGMARFTPLFGFSTTVIPEFLAKQPPGLQVDFAFLDGGDNPMEQIEEFQMLNPMIPIGGQIMGHDAHMRKGKWLVPYLSALDNWKTQVLTLSPMGLVHAVKVADKPTEKSQAEANRILKKLRRAPIEAIAAILPSWLCLLALRLMPTRLARRLAHGAK
ncbi:hypothetical protein BH09VER1_BH09VER1_00230 [soil metagenome]